ncbi:hypothetical protein GCM10011371_15010 [Novosphingobium marinum]|uniref:Putative membrane protein n=1 Tax=Novosphingobium marinum TaxID=1514948 RepID=A0A7Z0BVR8_9SPHN|nr:DUF1700 domain-containing protein [Novosphingobium marinum]NYH95615.1 putative membrane protein [Novosphingobium marinum]GGC28463.1 hypothetical protein GCM10011371_15010 [Novosphingobium marinum]
MKRDEFLKRLRHGLKGLPPEAIEDIVADYAAHFEAAADEGRSEEEVAEALGDPARLARELKLEAGFRRWEDVRSPSSAWTAIVALLGLGALDILVLLPIILPALGVVIGLYLAMFFVFVAGGFILIVGPFSAFPGGILTAMFGGLGMMAIAVALTALLLIATIGIVNALVWFGRLHYRVIEPAIHSEG